MKIIGHKNKRKRIVNNSIEYTSTKNSKSHQLNKNSDYVNIIT